MSIFEVRPQMAVLFSASALAIASLTVGSATIIPLSSRAYKPKAFESDWQEALKNDPAIGQKANLSFLVAQLGAEPMAVIMMGDCSPCGLSRLEKFRRASWASGRIVVVANSRTGLEALKKTGLERLGARFEIGTNADVQELNAFFVPRAYLIGEGGRLTALQSPYELVATFVESRLNR